MHQEYQWARSAMLILTNYMWPWFGGRYKLSLYERLRVAHWMSFWLVQTAYIIMYPVVTIGIAIGYVHYPYAQPVEGFRWQDFRNAMSIVLASQISIVLASRYFGWLRPHRPPIFSYEQELYRNTRSFYIAIVRRHGDSNGRDIQMWRRRAAAAVQQAGSAAGAPRGLCWNCNASPLPLPPLQLLMHNAGGDTVPPADVPHADCHVACSLSASLVLLLTTLRRCPARALRAVPRRRQGTVHGLLGGLLGVHFDFKVTPKGNTGERMITNRNIAPILIYAALFFGFSWLASSDSSFFTLITLGSFKLACAICIIVLHYRENHKLSKLPYDNLFSLLVPIVLLMAVGSYSVAVRGI